MPTIKTLCMSFFFIDDPNSGHVVNYLITLCIKQIIPAIVATVTKTRWYLLQSFVKYFLEFYRPYHFSFSKGCLPQTSFGPFLNTLSHMFLINNKKNWVFNTDFRWRLATKIIFCTLRNDKLFQNFQHFEKSCLSMLEHNFASSFASS